MTFLVFGLPRSRTAWLARFLTYGDWFCGHDELRHCRSLDDVRAWLSQPNTGSVETAAAPFWRMAMRLAPGARVVVVRRPVAEVVASLQRLGLPDLTTEMTRLDAKLQQIVARVPGALEVQFADLADEATCARVFEHCLGVPHDPEWWRLLAPMNLQIDFRALLRYAAAYKPALEKLARHARQQELAAMARRPEIETGALTFHQERFDDWYRDATPLFRSHMVATGQDVEDYSRKNLPLLRKLEEIGCLQVTTARCNGRMFGYLLTVISPSLDSPDITSAMHTAFFADSSFPGLGRKLQRAANDALRERGVDEAFFRAGVRGSGPRLGALFKRLGAEDFGQLFRLELQGA